MIQPMLPGKRVLLALGALATLTLSYANGFAPGLPGDQTQRCTLERYQKMVGYNCADLKLKEIPQYLKSGLLILDVSFNRIRDLNRQSFSRYTGVKYLYLFENMIQNIEEGTFSELTNLEALDLSNNALRTIPLEIFRLPLLRNLYVAYNKLEDLDEDLPRLQKPIGAPLQILSLAECWLERLPNFGILPDLWQLNISSNPMKDLTIDQFAPMCNLRSLDLNATRIPQCACQTITAELSTRRTVIYNSHPNCFAEHTACNLDTSTVPPTSPSPDEYQQCMDVRYARQQDTEAKTAWFKISLGVIACIVLFSIILCYIHRRNARNMKDHRKKHNTLKNSTPINRIIVPSEDDTPKVVENGNRDKLITDCD